MKFSNWCILAGALILIQTVSWMLQDRMLEKLEYTRICYNQIADNAVEDGVEAGLTDRYGVVDIDQYTSVEAFEESLLNGFDVTRDSAAGKRLLDKIGCLVILKNQYFVVKTHESSKVFYYETYYDSWTIRFTLNDRVECRKKGDSAIYTGTQQQIREKIGYNPENTELTWAGEVITECIERQVEYAICQDGAKTADYEIDFPAVEELSTHTIWGPGMLCFMKYDTYEIGNNRYDRYTLSVAQLKEKKI